jgi:hypothetical protein
MKIDIEFKVEQEELKKSGMSEADIEKTIDKQLTFSMAKRINDAVHIEQERLITGERIFKTSLYIITPENYEEIAKALEIVKNYDGASDAVKSFVNIALEKLKD